MATQWHVLWGLHANAWRLRCSQQRDDAPLLCRRFMLVAGGHDMLT